MIEKRYKSDISTHKSITEKKERKKQKDNKQYTKHNTAN